MKISQVIIIALLGAVAAIGAITLHGVFQKPVSSMVVVQVENRTGQEVRELRIEHEHGLVVQKILKPGQILVIPFVTLGESSYRLYATLSTGKVLQGGCGYVEAGYRTREILEPDRVVSKYN